MDNIRTPLCDNIVEYPPHPPAPPLLDGKDLNAGVRRTIASRLRRREEDLRLFDACRWLAEIAILVVVNNPVKLITRSQITVDDPAYFFDGVQK
jgi:hypothetical protein